MRLWNTDAPVPISDIDRRRGQKLLSPAWLKCWLLIGRWPVGTKPMLPAGSYVTSLGGLYVTMHVVKMVLNVNNHKVLCIQHGMENGGRISWEKKRSIVSINAEKTNNAPNNVERFKVSTVLMVMFNSVTFCWFALHETLILLSCCVFIEMVNCLNTIILKSFVIIVFTSILHLFYRTNTTQNMYHAFFYINRILDPITSDVIYNVTLSTWQYAPNTRN